MSEQSVVGLERALAAAGTPRGTRRWLLERAAIGAAGVSAAGVLVPGVASAAPGHHSAVRNFGTVAVTTEGLTVTLLTELLRRVNLHPEVPAGVKAVFEGAYAAEVDHLRFTRKYWRPTTTKFWIPDGFFGGAGNDLSLDAIGHALVAGETLFVDLYLIGVTVLAAAGNARFARFSAELAGCESEHRVLAESLIGTTPPNNVGFEVFSISDPAKIEAALEKAGVGFGKQGSAPGAFYQLADPVMTPPITINGNTPT